jgi:hypothetical protein
LLVRVEVGWHRPKHCSTPKKKPADFRSVKTLSFRYNSKADLCRQVEAHEKHNPRAKPNEAHLKEALAYATRMDNDPKLANVSAMSLIDYS